METSSPDARRAAAEAHLLSALRLAEAVCGPTETTRVCERQLALVQSTAKAQHVTSSGGVVAATARGDVFLPPELAQGVKAGDALQVSMVRTAAGRSPFWAVELRSSEDAWQTAVRRDRPRRRR